MSRQCLRFECYERYECNGMGLDSSLLPVLVHLALRLLRCMLWARDYATCSSTITYDLLYVCFLRADIHCCGCYLPLPIFDVVSP
jgi:hypothetical protein